MAVPAVTIDGAMSQAASSPRFPGIRLIAFDLDGALIDSSRDLVTAVNAARTRLAPAELADLTVLGYV